jgi:hypothetical protein
MQTTPGQPAEQPGGERVPGPDGVHDTDLAAGMVYRRGASPEEVRAARTVGDDDQQRAKVQPAATDLVQAGSAIEPVGIFAAGFDDVRHAHGSFDERARAGGRAEERRADVGVIADQDFAAAAQAGGRGVNPFVPRGGP